MNRHPTPRQLRVFTAQIIGGVAAVGLSVYLFPSWWSMLPLPLSQLLPAIYGATRDTLDERAAERRSGRQLAIKVHPSSWDEYLDLPKRKWTK